MEALLELQKIEYGPDSESPAAVATAEKLRVNIPPQILGHYDRLRARGKKGLALVRNQVCTACHVGVPIGTVMTVMKGLDIQLCGNCGRYLYVEPEAPQKEAEVPPPAAKPKAKRKAKKPAE